MKYLEEIIVYTYILKKIIEQLNLFYIFAINKKLEKECLNI